MKSYQSSKSLPNIQFFPDEVSTISEKTQANPILPHMSSWSTETVGKIKLLLFYATVFGVVCYAVIDSYITYRLFYIWKIKRIFNFFIYI